MIKIHVIFNLIQMRTSKNSDDKLFQGSQASDNEFRLLIESMEEYAIFVLDNDGIIKSWNKGAEKIFGYKEQEAIGKSTNLIFRREDIAKGIPELEIRTAAKAGRADDERRHIRKNGTEFWSSGIMSAIKDKQGKLRGFAKVCRDVTQKKLNDELIRHQAMHDPLTGLLNRKTFETRVVLQLAAKKKIKSSAALLLIDVDNFKQVNDQHSHDTGDLFLQTIATRLSSIVRTGDSVGRFGGDEFLLFIDDIKNAADAKKIIKKIFTALQPVAILNNVHFKIKVSIGVALYPDDAKTYSALLRMADVALYRAKDAGKNCFKLFKQEKTRKLQSVVKT